MDGPDGAEMPSVEAGVCCCLEWVVEVLTGRTVGQTALLKGVEAVAVSHCLEWVPKALLSAE